ncbi:MAG: hypothetical protein ABI823_19645 [Bryobacteraceae bacterium]
MAIVAVSAYWFLASIANWRIAVVTPSGVRTSLLPFPTGSGQSVRRDSVLHCFARHILGTDEMNAYVTADYYAMGVETVQGHQLDIHLPYPTEADALAAARDVAQVLNLNTYGRALDIQSVQTKMTYPTLRRMLLFWSAITFFAVYVGWRCG